MAFANYPSLAGKTVFVTGGASGIGEAIVRAFHAQGSKVGFLDLDEVAGKSLQDELEDARFSACDVCDGQALAATLEAASQALGPITVLINNVANDTRHSAETTSDDAWRRGLAVNLDPAFFAARCVFPAMAAKGGGVILNLGSINALLGPADMVTYVAAKAGIVGLSKALAREWGPSGVRVNTVSPGWVVTERQKKLWLTPEAEAAWMEQVALKSRIMPDDVARLCLFLASDDAAMITGQNLVIDGGRT
jgi:NAD(P)-dependent dehydrogenase (short-subunit alcohol dehydrogenase family)